GAQVRRYDREWALHLFERANRKLSNKRADPFVRVKMIALPHELERALHACPWEEIFAAKRKPHIGEQVDAGGCRIGGDGCGVECSDAGPYKEVGNDTGFDQSAQLADLNRAENPSAGQHERHVRAFARADGAQWANIAAELHRS